SPTYWSRQRPSRRTMVWRRCSSVLSFTELPLRACLGQSFGRGPRRRVKALHTAVARDRERVPGDAERQHREGKKRAVQTRTRGLGQRHGWLTFHFFHGLLQDHYLEHFEIVHHAYHRIDAADDKECVHRRAESGLTGRRVALPGVEQHTENLKLRGETHQG